MLLMFLMKEQPSIPYFPAFLRDMEGFDWEVFT